MKEKAIKKVVKNRYARIAKEDQQSCCPTCACGDAPLSQAPLIGYSKEDPEHAPRESIMGLGCGNPIAIADLKLGEVVLDLGSGAGVDVFLAANKVGPTGKVIGVDMTKEMVKKARTTATGHGYHNVEFRLGEIENLPLQDESVDAVISNCVINLSPDKPRVFREAYRVLKPKGRLVVSDIVTERALPDETRGDPDAWASCIGGALEQQEYLENIRKVGFRGLHVLSSKEFYIEGEGNGALTKLLSITVKAYK
ncbi:MAG: arsenite methyltransferase [Dehalococcoidia bacterium]